MKVQGVTSLVINVHHYAEQIISFLEEKNYFNIPIAISDERDELLETGGGLLKAASLLNNDEPFIMHNVDILSELDLRSMYNEHKENNALATLAVRHRETSRYLLFDEHDHLKAWENRKTGEQILNGYSYSKLTPLAFSGIHVISPQIFPLIKERGSFSIIDTYLRLCGSNVIRAYRHDRGLWIDAGKPDGLRMADTLMGGR